ncbi:hypothetical protein CK203_076675 [Vitis vinifera]|uniref:Uncharacterized protein n=1 Tax=Vitis vinifera TaxID=29760 RepID=A0A438EPD5_VITVI|nr:hypothetical protein CK203_076675 [Vitis vinifera]
MGLLDSGWNFEAFDVFFGTIHEAGVVGQGEDIIRWLWGRGSLLTVALERFFRIMGPFSSSVCGSASGDAEDGFRSFRGWCRRFETRRSNHVEGGPFVLFVDSLERGIEKSRCCLSLTHCSFTLCPLGLVDVEHGETLVCPT